MWACNDACEHLKPAREFCLATRIMSHLMILMSTNQHILRGNQSAMSDMPLQCDSVLVGRLPCSNLQDR